MPRTCSRMKPSASPKPASGPVFGLTWPILMTRLWALAGITRSTAGAAMAPRPERTSIRREMPELKSCDASLGISASVVAFGHCGHSRTPPGHRDRSAIGDASLLEMLQHLGPQRGLSLRAPGAKALARFEAELALGHQRFEIGRGAAAVLDIGQDRFVNGERQVGADEIGILERAQDG